MNRKHNPFLSLAALLVLAVLLLFLVGCSGNAEAADAEYRFAFNYDYSDFNNQAIIITDTKTGEQYLYIDGHKAGAIVRLEPKEAERALEGQR